MRRRRFLGWPVAVGLGLGLAPRISANARELPEFGRELPKLQAFDDLMRRIVHDQKLPGGSLSLAKDGRLVYARAFGWASIEDRIPARPAMRYGLASVSKAITAVAILRLADQGKLRLDQPVLSILHDLKPLPGRRMDPRLQAVTLRQLLQHTAGYRAQPDPHAIAREFRVPLPKLKMDQLIRGFLGEPLATDPGSAYFYSNFGFTLLGAVVERAIGEEYGVAVHRLVFAPLGIKLAHVGRGGPRRPDTVWPYDGQGRPMPPIDIPGEAAGGWVVATVELVRMLSALNGARGEPFLSPPMFEQMLAPAPPPVGKPGAARWVGLGWDVVTRSPRGPSFQKNGGMGGVRAVIGHEPEGVDWAVAFNGGRDLPDHIGVDGDAAHSIRQTIRRTEDWPRLDQFPDFA